VLKAARHWGSNGSVVNDLLGESGRTTLFVDLPSGWHSVKGECFFPRVSWENPLTGDSERYERRNKPVALEMVIPFILELNKRNLV